jgi:hypothetical protein
MRYTRMGPPHAAMPSSPIPIPSFSNKTPRSNTASHQRPSIAITHCRRCLQQASMREKVWHDSSIGKRAACVVGNLRFRRITWILICVSVSVRRAVTEESEHSCLCTVVCTSAGVLTLSLSPPFFSYAPFYFVVYVYNGELYIYIVCCRFPCRS